MLAMDAVVTIFEGFRLPSHTGERCLVFVPFKQLFGNLCYYYDEEVTARITGSLIVLSVFPQLF